MGCYLEGWLTRENLIEIWVWSEVWHLPESSKGLKFERPRNLTQLEGIGICKLLILKIGICSVDPDHRNDPTGSRLWLWTTKTWSSPVAQGLTFGKVFFVGSESEALKFTKKSSSHTEMDSWTWICDMDIGWLITWLFLQIGVSQNSGTPKSSILIGFSIIFTIHFGVPLFLVQHPNVQHPLQLQCRYHLRFESWVNMLETWIQLVNVDPKAWSSYTPPKTNMEPQNWWFVVVSPIPRNIFRFHVNFQGCRLKIGAKRLLCWLFRFDIYHQAFVREGCAFIPPY